MLDFISNVHKASIITKQRTEKQGDKINSDRSILIREAAKKVLFIVDGSLSGGGGATKEKNNFLM